MKKLSCFLLFAMLLVKAQTLDCSQLMTQSFPTSPKLETAEVQITTAVEPTAENDAITTNIFQVMDIPNRRIYMEMTMPDNSKTITRYQKGKGTITMMIDGEAITSPFPAEAGTQLEKMFDNVLSNQLMLPENYEVISCDGVQSYAGLIEGEQITVHGDIPNLGNTEMRVIIDTKEQRIGSVFTLPQTGETLSIMDGIVMAQGEFPDLVEVSMYKLEQDNATLTMNMKVDYLSVNQPLDETLFNEQ